jgi:hypothetical protein
VTSVRPANAYLLTQRARLVPDESAWRSNFLVVRPGAFGYASLEW